LGDVAAAGPRGQDAHAENDAGKFGKVPDVPAAKMSENVPRKGGMTMDTPRTREEAGDALESIADQIEEGIAKGRFSLKEIQSAMMQKGKQAAQSTDQIVHENPWYSVGIAAALGLVVGLLMPRGD
jgi:ElaB/YqjD/DUF883 family membrane-anchored ribosome-binding protein